MTRFAGQKVDMSTYMQDSPDYGNLGNQSQTSRSRLKQSGLMNEAQMASAGLKGMSDVMGAKFGADATKAQASAAESAGMWNMIGSIGGGLIGAIGKGSGSFSDPFSGNKSAGEAGWIDFGNKGTGLNYADSNGKLTW